ncbi:MORC family CW-type zinc finger protein 3-like [Mugil cephalus]|uniref:MORC family CW-type zinc finger protein 3-like n=1 Tax=Mugil cephalus TaxID=48193 RepID=UPI001FB58D28|nr:MORC family CW-type zinc finger protein 3-like [Mugil cephalus]XP_047457139.1 MORC family CW-type zinc finger protein 3-like [Mugil cephalus]
MATTSDHVVPLSMLSPKFLHSNSTSHTWPFSAIAELIDNAYDPDVNAKHFWIDKTVIKGEECLIFMDDGNGLDYETMRKMLSFGYSDKTALRGKQPIGIYGNGFKSGSMRLGQDVIVFSKSKNASCVGMLSRTYLEKTAAEQIVVPIVSFEERESESASLAKEEHEASLQDILLYSPFNKQEELLIEINAITSSWSKTKTGSRIIIWNLRSTSTRRTEFDFQTDCYDIRIPSDVYEDLKESTQTPDKVTSHIPECVFSLRAYCSILYLKPRMQIVVRGQKVKSQLVAKSLACIRKDHYKPTFLNRRIPITFGYNTMSKDQYGIMMYHKNRLIKAYERVGCQLKGNNMGVGVIGVIECDFLDPTHNKQDFMDTENYRKTINNLGIKLEEYWKEIRYRKTKDNPNCTVPVEDTMKQPDQNWVSCDECMKWRKLPDGIDNSKLPEKWFCYLNPDPQFRSCNVDEEAEDFADDQPSYTKTYKQEENKKKREMKKTTTVHSPSTSSSEIAESTPLSSSAVSQAACSPSRRSSGLPVIPDGASLSVTPQRRKRSQAVTSQVTQKKTRVNDHSSAPATPSSVDVRPHDEKENDDDDIVILETASTPKPNKLVLHFVKNEEESSEIPISMECDNDAAVDATSASSQNQGRGWGRELSFSLEAQHRLQNQSEVKVKKEVSHQGSQTEETEEKIDYKSLFEKIKKKVNELIKDNEALFEATEMKPNSEEEDSDEISMMFGRLLHELDERNQERDELRSQLNSLEDRNAKLEAKCELLKLTLKDQQKENSAEGNESMRG